MAKRKAKIVIRQWPDTMAWSWWLFDDDGIVLACSDWPYRTKEHAEEDLKRAKRLLSSAEIEVQDDD